MKPKFPKKAKVLGIKEASCLVRFYIDEKGKPEKVNPLKKDTCSPRKEQSPEKESPKKESPR